MLVIAGVFALVICASADTSIYQGYVYDNYQGSWHKTDTATVWSSAPNSNSTMTPCGGCDHGYYSIPAYPAPSAGTYWVKASKTIGGNAYGSCGWFYYNGENTTFGADLYMTHPATNCPEQR
jgi:hypothetical protein